MEDRQQRITEGASQPWFLASLIASSNASFNQIELTVEAGHIFSHFHLLQGGNKSQLPSLLFLNQYFLDQSQFLNIYC